MVPVRDAGEDDPLEVREDRVERFARLGRRWRKGVADVAGLTARAPDSVRAREVVGDPVGDPVRLAAERLRIHVAEFGGRHPRDSSVLARPGLIQ